MYVINKELYHHGVLGMKWGVRRYQPYGTAYDGETNGKFLGMQKPWEKKHGKTVVAGRPQGGNKNKKAMKPNVKTLNDLEKESDKVSKNYYKKHKVSGDHELSDKEARELESKIDALSNEHIKQRNEAHPEEAKRISAIDNKIKKLNRITNMPISSAQDRRRIADAYSELEKLQKERRQIVENINKS